MNRNWILRIIVLWLFATIFSHQVTNAQRADSANSVVTFDELYNSPYDINQLFIHIQPLYGELFVTNVNVGFGLEVDYYPSNKIDLSVQWRRAYARATDFSRETAHKNRENTNSPKSFNYLELGGTFHLIDQEQSSQTKIVLYSKRYAGKRWSTSNPKMLQVPGTVRKIYGLRFGGLLYRSATDLGRALQEQGIILKDQSGGPITATKLYNNVNAKVAYLGGSLTLIKNFAIRPHRDFGVLVNDLMFNSYVDIMYGPSITMDDIQVDGILYSSDPIETTKLGFRLGVEGKFNKKVGYGYGAEFGYRPGIKGRTFYTMFKMSFPVIGLIPSKDAI